MSTCRHLTSNGDWDTLPTEDTPSLYSRQREPFAVVHGTHRSVGPRLANLQELSSTQFTTFMAILNNFASGKGLRQFTNWSKVWEYPWLWFNGLVRVNWSQTTLLDVGSELSPMPWFLASLGARVMLVEKDDQWVDTWDRLRKETGLGVNWAIVTGERLPFQDESFDVVTSFSVIEHQQHKSQAINEVARVLKTGGLFAVSFDICEPEMNMSYPEWGGGALTTREFEEIIWNNPAFDNGGLAPTWNFEDCEEFLRWHLQSAPHHNYVVGAAILMKKPQ